VTVEQPVDLVLEAGAVAPAPAGIALDAELVHEGRKRLAEDQFLFLRADGLRTEPCEQ